MKTYVCLFCGAFMMLSCTYDVAAAETGLQSQVLIIKAAGYEEGEKPQNADAITEATSVGRNVHVVSQAVYDQLNGREVDAVIEPFYECEKLESMIQNGVDLIVFAGPVYSSRFPEPLQDLAASLYEDILHTGTLCTTLTSCRFLDSGGETLQAFDSQLHEQGIQTIDGLVVHHEYEDEDWETKVQLFAERIQQTISQ